MKVCARPGCPTVVDAKAYRGLCPTHRAERDRERGTAAERGYGPEFAKLRRAYAKRIAAGETIPCWRCHKRILGRRWHLGHSDDRTEYRGPECEPCNLSAAGKAAHGVEST